MKKITSLFTVAALSLTFAAAGCKKKAAEENKDPATKTEEKGSAATAASGSAEVKKEEPKAADGSAAAPAAGGDFPAECNDYKAAVDKMMGCEKMKATAGAMKDGFDQTWKGLEAAPAAARAGMAAGCKAGADAIKQSLTAMGC